MKPPFFVTIPHSGEQIPPEVFWLQKLPEPIQMCDVDRFVDVLYEDALTRWQIPQVVTSWHRYFADLNRLPEDVDASSVEGAPQPAGQFSQGFIWTKTTRGDVLLENPISSDLHRRLVLNYWQPFHDQVIGQYKKWKSLGYGKVFQLDAHSMPSKGTKAHRDPGELRAQIVVSDQNGKSCDPRFRDLVVASYEGAGFQVKLNWPYVGGRVTQTYGQPDLGQHCIQVEMNRALYMDEESKKMLPERVPAVKKQIEQALGEILKNLSSLV